MNSSPCSCLSSRSTYTPFPTVSVSCTSSRKLVSPSQDECLEACPQPQQLLLNHPVLLPNPGEASSTAPAYRHRIPRKDAHKHTEDMVIHPCIYSVSDPHRPVAIAARTLGAPMQVEFLPPKVDL
ncbi:hypothetical protein CIHG_03260 [Coccidioides immitis H538.4]|uniref:Uncharacterized protein n=3 Tax=Coccidioides immitis TaxID=5501 RepID=A0A0J8QSS7_COCIT|nr:hypothetical protein CIRG_00955 [Coccidioides immitis RMSCC 2394]KMU75531.1 hypothetical protein CISG_04934 [Coccidioides immitis RMSCC 3703]KMU85478.1 hypothetical protein CIHG_03260 [Coccidioides immitis H538.4]